MYAYDALLSIEDVADHLAECGAVLEPDEEVARLPVEVCGRRAVLELHWSARAAGLVAALAMPRVVEARMEACVARELGIIAAVLAAPGFVISPVTRQVVYRTLHLFDDDLALRARDLDDVVTDVLSTCEACAPVLEAITAPMAVRTPCAVLPRFADRPAVGPDRVRSPTVHAHCGLLRSAADLCGWVWARGWRYQRLEDGQIRLWLDTAPGAYLELTWNRGVGQVVVDAMFPVGQVSDPGRIDAGVVEANAHEVHPGFLWGADEHWLRYRLPVRFTRSGTVAASGIERAMGLAAATAVAHRASFALIQRTRPAAVAAPNREAATVEVAGAWAAVKPPLVGAR